MEEVVLNSGDTAWMLASTALVLLMTPGLAFFYGGMVRTKSVLNMMMMSMVTIGIVSILWVIYGFELAFGYKSDSPWYGGIGLSNLGGQVNELTNNGGVYPIPVLVFAAFQLMFAIITPALISGAIADRAKFTSWAIFVAIWSTVVYFPVAHWVFAFGNKVGDTITSTGYLAGKGVQDFAGGTAVHINAGAAGLALAIVLGKRIGWRKESMRPHSLPLVMLGSGLLWFGWFGFNAGSALSVGSLATVAFVATMVSASAGGLTWAIVEWYLRGKPTAVGIASGFLAGLVGVTPAAGFVTPVGAILIGSITAVCCFYAVSWRVKLEFDDSLDTYSVHGVGGTVGAILTGVFATKSVNPAGFDGLLYGNPGQLIPQIVGVVATYIFAGAGTFVIIKILDSLMELRVKPMVEEQGLDIDQHGEEAYGEDFASGLSFSTGSFSGKER